jgi:hypothetical protein
MASYVFNQQQEDFIFLKVQFIWTNESKQQTHVT